MDGSRPVLSSAGFDVPKLEELIKSTFPKELNLKELFKDLSDLEDVWMFAYPGLGTYHLHNPTFTVKGDTVIELRPASPLQLSIPDEPHFGASLTPLADRPPQLRRISSRSRAYLFVS